MNPLPRQTLRALLAVLAVVLTLEAGGSAQGLGQPGSFGGSDGTREYETITSDGSPANRYFIHDQAVKIAIVGGLSVLAVALLTVRGFQYRKWLLLLSIGLVGFYVGGVLCPLSSVQNVFLKWNSGYLLLFLVPIVLALLIGRVFCGTVCPFGAMQELLHVRRWALRIPVRWRRPLGALKYLILIYLVTRVIVTGTSTLQGHTPFNALFAWGGTSGTIALTAVTAALSVFLWRPFCGFFCPLGALLSLVSRFSLFRLEAESNCVSCGRCTAGCPSGACENGRIRSADCFLCGECVRTCPMGSLRLVTRWRRKVVRFAVAEKDE